MTQNRKTILNNRKAVSKAKTATRKAERKGKRYLSEVIMADDIACAEEKWPYMVLREYEVTFSLTGTAYKVNVDCLGSILVTDTIPEFPEYSGINNSFWDCVFECGEYYIECYALDEEHAKEVALNRLQTMLKGKAEQLREQIAYVEFQAANLPELLGLA